MPRNGSGTYTAPSNTFNPATPFTTISTTAWNATLADLVAALTDSLSRSGSGGMQAALAMGGFKVTGAADATLATDLATLGQIQAGYQPLDADLTAIAALTSAADRLPYSTGAQTWALATFTAAGRALVDDADASAQRTTLGATAAGSAMFTAANATAQTALLDAFTGDSGSGGVKGLVPAPAAGDAAAVKFLNANGAWVAPGAASLPAGSVVGSAFTRYTTYTSGTTAMAGGVDTVPQITDGTEITTLAYTPTSATNILRITVTGPYSASAGANQWVALFRDATAAAKAAQGIGTASADTLSSFSLQFEEVAGSTSATTYRIRFGNPNGVASTWAVNGTSAGRRFGGSTGLVIKIEEIKV
jgi:hypothetical protein